MQPAVTFVGVVSDTIELNAMGDQINERHYKTLWRFQDQYFVASAAYFAQDPQWGGISVNETFIYETNRNGDHIDGGTTLAEYEWFSASHSNHRNWIEEVVMVKETAR
jgi:hypothetical protein